MGDAPHEAKRARVAAAEVATEAPGVGSAARACDFAGARALASALAAADAVVVLAGAGMSAGCCAPCDTAAGGAEPTAPPTAGYSAEAFAADFPSLHQQGDSYETVATPGRFATDPEVAWGFFGYRAGFDRTAVPPPGYQQLRAALADREYWVFTSNTDGLFQVGIRKAARL